MAEHRKLELQYTKDFDRDLKRLAKRGGIADAVHKQVVRAIAMWQEGLDPALPITHHGETRIAHVVKYDLKSHYRLVVREDAGMRIPLAVGNHQEMDQWLESHRGWDFVVNRNTKRIQTMPASTDKAVTKATTADVEVVAKSKGAILARLPDELIKELQLSAATLKSLNAFVTFENVGDENIWNLIQGLTFPTEDHRQALLQTIALLAAGYDEKARERVRLFLGEATTATQSPNEFREAVESGMNCDEVVSLSNLASDEIERIVGTDGLTDWMLFLHPDQRKLVEREYKGPARLTGVSGSGKTSVLVHRANFLAKKYPAQRVLVLTLNPALVQLLGHLLDALCSPAVREQIEVRTVYQYCYDAIKMIEPKRLIEKHDHKSGEDLRACWQDFMEKPHALDSVAPLISALESREDFVDGRSYILDELIWIRSGFGRNERERYLTCERPGRGLVLVTYDSKSKSSGSRQELFGLPLDARPRILQLLKDYEKYMSDGGLLDDDGVSLEAFSLKSQIRDHPKLQSRCVLVDEVQDCSSVELAVVAQIPTNAENGLFLTGDPVQKVFPKQHDLVQAGIDIIGRGAVLRKNYRNSRQILEAAFEIIKHFKDQSPVPAGDILVPEYAFRDGSKPKLYECASREEQVRLITTYLELIVPEDYGSTCICSQSSESLSAFESACMSMGLPTFRIADERKAGDRLGDGIKLSLFQNVKGYEFKNVFLTDLTDTHLLPKGMPFEERWRIAFQVYVAMTRARDDLVMSFIYNRSILLGPLGDTVDESLAVEMIE